MGYMQKHGGGYTDNVWILDGIELTNAQSTDEVHTKHVHEKEITVQKDANNNFIFPVISEEWQQPHDGRKMTRRIFKKGDLIMPKSNRQREGQTSQAND